MSRILRLYVIREVALPTFLTLMTLIFILLMGKVYDLIVLLLQPSVTLFQVLEALMSVIPSLMVLAVPMAILIGVLIGVGRMTMDREMLAARASGINLFSIFAPAIVLGLLASLTIMGLYSKAIPRILGHGVNRIGQMQLALFTSLEPGQFHSPKDMSLGDSMGDFEFFFRERDPEDPNLMKGILIKLAEDTAAAKEEKKAKDKKDKLAKGDGSKTDDPLAGIVSSSTLRNAAAALVPAKAGPGAGDEQPPAAFRRNELTLITAASGKIGSAFLEDGKKTKETRKTSIVLELKNGQMHQLNANPQDRQYTFIAFDKGEKRLVGSAEVDKLHKTLTNRELRKIIKDSKQEKDLRREARRELIQRYAISLASFVFMLVGIPLAIWVRPSGKSWGILLAVGLMLVYYVIMNLGLGMVKYDKPLGIPLTFLPNLLFLVLGAGLWRHTVRS